MRGRLIYPAALLLASGCTTFQREATWLTLHAADAITTHQIQSTDGVDEVWSPWLGRNPSTSTIYSYFILTAIIHVTLSYTLPEKYSKWWQALTIAGSSAALINNCEQGLCQ